MSTANRRMAAFLDVYGECRDSNISFGAVQTRSVCEPVGMANCVSLHARTKMGTDAYEHRSHPHRRMVTFLDPYLFLSGKAVFTASSSEIISVFLERILSMTSGIMSMICVRLV